MDGRRRALLLAVGCAVVAAIAYLPSIRANFAYDDRHAIFQNPAVVGDIDVKKIFLDPAAFSGRPGRRMYRPLTLLSYSINYRLAGFKMEYWHATHIFFHALNAALLFLIARKLFGSDKAAAAATLLWAIHPLISEAVVYQAARSNLISTTAVLAGFLIHLGDINPRLKAAAVSILLLIGLLFKETAIVLPALIFAHDFIFKKKRSSAALYLTPMIVTVVGYMLFRRYVLDVVTLSVDAPVRPLWSNLLSQSGAMMLYLSKTLWPFGLSIEHDLPTATGLTSAAEWWQWPVFAIPVIVALLVAATLSLKRAPTIAFGIAWWFVSLMPESSLIPLVQVANERRMYMPLVGLVIVAIALLEKLREKKPLPTAIFAAILAMLFALNIASQSAWRSTIRLFENAIRIAPASIPARHGLASALLDAGDEARAKRAYLSLNRIAPNYYGAKVGLARILIAERDYSAAEKLLIEATAIDPSEDVAWIALSDAYLKSDRVSEAEQAARRAVSLNPISAQGWNNLGVAFARSERYPDALDAIGRAIKLDPGYAIAYFNRGNVYRSMGDTKSADRDYRRALELDPSFAPALKVLER